MRRSEDDALDRIQRHRLLQERGAKCVLELGGGCDSVTHLRREQPEDVVKILGGSPRQFDDSAVVELNLDAACYLTSVSILNIGRYIEMMITPTIRPTPSIITGSTIDVSAPTDASTSSS